jgi:D-lactate dehydrogenase (cytochrome)
MKEFTREQISALAELVESDRFSTGQSNRELHRHDISPHYGTLPAGIIWPKSTDEVADILSWCYEMEYRISG